MWFIFQFHFLATLTDQVCSHLRHLGDFPEDDRGMFSHYPTDLQVAVTHQVHKHVAKHLEGGKCIQPQEYTECVLLSNTECKQEL